MTWMWRKDSRGPVPRESLKRSSSSRAFLGFFDLTASTPDFSAFAVLLCFTEGRAMEGSKTVSGTLRFAGLGGGGASSVSLRFRFKGLSSSLVFLFFLDFLSLSERREDEDEALEGVEGGSLPLEAKMSSISEVSMEELEGKWTGETLGVALMKGSRGESRPWTEASTRGVAVPTPSPSTQGRRFGFAHWLSRTSPSDQRSFHPMYV